MKPMHALQAWWRGRQPRERAMLAVMAALLAAFAWWYGLLWPLRALRDDAGERHDRAAHALQEARVQAAALAGRPAALPPGDRDALLRLLHDSTREAGLVPGRQRSAADGAVVLEFERVEAPVLFGWLGRLADEAGLAPSLLQVQRADGRLRAEVGFGGSAP